MQILATIVVAVVLLAGLLVAIFKGSRPPQPIASSPTPPKRAAIAAFVPVVCAVIQYATFRALASYLWTHLAPPKPLIVLFLVGLIAPWFVGLYFAYSAARAANVVLRAIGASEVLIFLMAAGLVLLSR
jgi:hypothetical protein